MNLTVISTAYELNGALGTLYENPNSDSPIFIANQNFKLKYPFGLNTASGSIDCFEDGNNCAVIKMPNGGVVIRIKPE